MNSAVRPAVSVIVPVHDTEEYLVRCLESLAAQTLEGIEVIVVDDGSTDSSGAIANAFAADHPGFTVLHTPAGGRACARNAGLDAARGEFVGFVDSDDYVASRMFRILHDAAVDNGADMVVCEYLGEDPDTGARHRYRECPSERYGRSLLDDPDLMACTGASVCNKLYRRTLFERGHIRFPSGLDFEDLATAYRLMAEASTIVKIDECLYHYTLGRRGSIMSSCDERFLDLPPAMAVALEHFERHGTLALLRPQLEALGLEHLLKGRFADLLVRAPRQVRLEYLDAAYAHLDRWFPEWRDGAVLRRVAPGRALRALLRSRTAMRAVAGLPPRAVTAMARWLGVFAGE